MNAHICSIRMVLSGSFFCVFVVHSMEESPQLPLSNKSTLRVTFSKTIGRDRASKILIETRPFDSSEASTFKNKPTARDSSGRTYFHLNPYATEAREVIEALEAKSDSSGLAKHELGRQDCHGRTPLHYAQSAELVKLYCYCGADPNAEDFLGRTPLFYSTNKSVVEALVKAGARVAFSNGRKTPLHFVMLGRVARAMLRAGLDPHARDLQGNTPLHRVHSFSVAHVLVYRDGVNPIKLSEWPLNNEGETPLHTIDDPEILELLVNDARGDIGLLNSAGMTPLRCFIDRYYTRNLRLDYDKLLLAVKMLSPRVEDDETLFFMHHDEQVIIFLRDLGIDLKKKNTRGQTALERFIEKFFLKEILISKSSALKIVKLLSPGYTTDREALLLLTSRPSSPFLIFPDSILKSANSTQNFIIEG